MIRYPAIFSDNIKKTFGLKGKQWLIDLEKTVKQSIEKWDLTDCRPVKNLSFNYVCSAESRMYGPVILKIGVRENEVFQEYRALRYMKKGNICSCYDYDRENNAMLLQRIEPGENLYSLKNPEQQIRIGCRLLERMPGKPDAIEDFPHYRDLIKSAYGGAGKIIPACTEEASEYYQDVEKLNIEDRILHGDFHHQNILKDKNNEWFLIDPKGVAGKQPMECGRFIMNQLDVLDRKDHQACLKLMINSFAGLLDVPAEAIFKAAFAEYVLSCCWTLEGDLNKREEEEVITDLRYRTDLYRNYNK